MFKSCLRPSSNPACVKMTEAKPCSHMAVFVLMTIVLMASTTTATPRQFPPPAVEGRDVAAQATQDRVSRHGIAAGSHHERLVRKEGLGPVMAREEKKRTSIFDGVGCKGTQNVSWTVEVKTGSRLSAGTDNDVFISPEGVSAPLGSFFKIDTPNHNDFERSSIKKYHLCTKDLGDQISGIAVYTVNKGGGPAWYLNQIKVLYKGRCYLYYFNHWVYGGIKYYKTNAQKCYMYF